MKDIKLLPHQVEMLERLRNLKMPTDVMYSSGIKSLKDFVDEPHKSLILNPNKEMRDFVIDYNEKHPDTPLHVEILKQRPVGDMPFHVDYDSKLKDRK